MSNYFTAPTEAQMRSLGVIAKRSSIVSTFVKPNGDLYVEADAHATFHTRAYVLASDGRAVSTQLLDATTYVEVPPR